MGTEVKPVTIDAGDLRLLMDYAGKEVPADDDQHEVNKVLARCGEALEAKDGSEEESGTWSPDVAGAGVLLRTARVAAGLTQEALAACIGVTQTCVSYWEAGKREMGAGDLQRAAAALGIAAGDLLPATGQPVTQLGEYARVDIMGHDWKIGFVSNGSLAGASCLDVRDASGRLIAKIPPHTVYLYTPMEVPREPAAALPAGDSYEVDDDPAWRERGGEPF